MKLIILWHEKGKEPQLLTQDKDNGKPVFFRKKHSAFKALRLQRAEFPKEKYSLYQEVPL